VTDNYLVDTLAFWHPYRDIELDENYLPWGIIAPGSSADKDVRVKNCSANYTAIDVTVSVDTMDIEEPALSVAVQHLLSTDGQRFIAAVDIGTLPPGATSSRITVRRVTSLDADLGDGDFQLLAHPTEWV
jgi:hypothetical protein